MQESEYSGHPLISKTDEKVVRLEQLVHENRYHYPHLG
jgi:hypothetical protein